MIDFEHFEGKPRKQWLPCDYGCVYGGDAHPSCSRHNKLEREAVVGGQPPDKHAHAWVEKRRIVDPDNNGNYILMLWDERNYVTRKVPIVYLECHCGDSLIRPLQVAIVESKPRSHFTSAETPRPEMGKALFARWNDSAKYTEVFDGENWVMVSSQEYWDKGTVIPRLNKAAEYLLRAAASGTESAPVCDLCIRGWKAVDRDGDGVMWHRTITKDWEDIKCEAQPSSLTQAGPTAKEFWKIYYQADPDFPPSSSACTFAEAYFEHRAAQSQKGGGKMKYEILADKTNNGTWRVEAIDHANEGICFVTIFSGPDAESRAREYVTWKNQ